MKIIRCNYVMRLDAKGQGQINVNVKYLLSKCKNLFFGLFQQLRSMTYAGIFLMKKITCHWWLVRVTLVVAFGFGPLKVGGGG